MLAAREALIPQEEVFVCGNTVLREVRRAVERGGSQRDERARLARKRRSLHLQGEAPSQVQGTERVDAPEQIIFSPSLRHVQSCPPALLPVPFLK